MNAEDGLVIKEHIAGLGTVQVRDPGPSYTHLYIDIAEGVPPFHLPKDKKDIMEYLVDAALLLDVMSTPGQIRDMNWFQYHSFALNPIGITTLLSVMWLLFYVGGYHGKNNQSYKVSREDAIRKVLDLWWAHN